MIHKVVRAQTVREQGYLQARLFAKAGRGETSTEHTNVTLNKDCKRAGLPSFPARCLNFILMLMLMRANFAGDLMTQTVAATRLLEPSYRHNLWLLKLAPGMQQPTV